jgi:PAS domain S-box-containing protein
MSRPVSLPERDFAPEQAQPIPTSELGRSRRWWRALDPSLLARPWYFYAIALASVALALLLRILMDATFAVRAPALPFAFAVIVSAGLGGFLPGMLSSLLSFVAVWFFIPNPLWTQLGSQGLLLAALFILFGLVVSVVSEAAYRHRALTRKQHTYLEEALDPVFAWTFDGTIVFWGGGARRLYGYSAREAVGRRVQDLLRVDWPESFGDLLDTLRTGNAWSGEVRHIGRDGRVRIVQSRMTRVQHENDPAVIVESTRDITDRRAAETRLELVLATAGDALVSFDRHWHFTYLNEAAARAFGESSQTLLGQSVWERYPELVGSPYYRALHQAALEQREIRTELPAMRVDEWMEHHIYPSVDGVTVLSSDITVRKRLEAESREEGRRKDEFIAMLAHELRGPLAPIRNCVQVLRRLSGSNALMAEATETMERQMRHLVRLIEDLLDLSRIRRGQIELRRSVISVADAVRMAVDDLRPSIDAHGLHLTVSWPQEPLMIDADPARIEQIVHNLLTNAVKYSDRGASIDVAIRDENGAVVIEIADTGVGIPPESLPHLFEMFEQVPEHRDRARGGLGIGLSLVRNLVELHGGTIVARSAGQGHGSTFTIRLPRTNAAATAIAPIEQEPTEATKSLRVLVVDDNTDAASSLAVLLELSGHEVECAHDGLEALAVAERFGPHVVLMDLGMPKMDGYTTARQIRMSSWGEGMKLIALTGWGHATDRQRSKEAGFDAHLVKPVDTTTLEQTIRRLT